MSAEVSAIAAPMQASMNAEDRRRELAGQSLGLGALVQLPQSPAGPGVGLSDMDLPVIGEGYDQTADIAAAAQKAYGEARPSYADPSVGGAGYPLGIAQAARGARHEPGSRWPADRAWPAWARGR
jgi:hypothetical protein